MDCAFTVVIIHQLVVCYWRGVWVFMDVHLYQGDPLLSAMTSLGIAFGLMIVIGCAQPGFNKLYRQVKHLFIHKKVILLAVFDLQYTFLSSNTASNITFFNTST